MEEKLIDQETTQVEESVYDSTQAVDPVPATGETFGQAFANGVATGLATAVVNVVVGLTVTAIIGVVTAAGTAIYGGIKEKRKARREKKLAEAAKQQTEDSATEIENNE